MKLDDVVNPANNNQMVVTRNDPPPPPTPPASSPRDVGNGGAIFDGDHIHAAASASATVENVDNGDNWIATMDGAGPADVQFNWEEVSQVDEYYNTTSGQYDLWATLPDGMVLIFEV